MQNTSVDNYLDIGPQNDKSHGIFGFHGYVDISAGFGLSQQTAFCPPKVMLAGINQSINRIK